MLIEFQVENFRSFRDRQTLSMVASRIPDHEETNTFDSGLKNFDRLLRASVIYGPNAAGKTNLLRALKFVRHFVINSASATVGNYQYTPFLFARESRGKASHFQIAFAQDGIRYDYTFSMGPSQIEYEALTEYVQTASRVRGRTMFERKWDKRGKKYSWEFSSFLKGQRSVWSASTRPDALFLSTAIQLNSEQLKPAFEWFQKRLIVIADETTLNNALTLQLLNRPEGKAQLLPFLKEADLGITDLKIQREKLAAGGVLVGKGTVPMLDAQHGVPNIVTVTLAHASDNPEDPVHLPFDDESSGTKILFHTAGAWLNVFANGEVLIFDEIDTNMHPKLLRFLISKFHSSKQNPRNAQLICSTHNTSLLDQDIFRRDQVWFVEKDRRGASRVYPLSQFKPRNDEVLERWYMRGRYGALPLVGESAS